jgi:hypothetical protein
VARLHAGLEKVSGVGLMNQESMNGGPQGRRAYVYHGLVGDAAELGKRLSSWFGAGERAYLAAFRPDDRRLWWFDPSRAGAIAAEWDEGRVFSARREARWQRARLPSAETPATSQNAEPATPEDAAEGYAVWLLAEEGNLPDLEGMQPVDVGPDGWRAVDRSDETRGIYLWGQYKEEEASWIEVRLPKGLEYPVGDERRTENALARVGHFDYQAPNGAVQFVRLTEVI